MDRASDFFISRSVAVSVGCADNTLEVLTTAEIQIPEVSEIPKIFNILNNSKSFALDFDMANEGNHSCTVLRG